MGGRGVIVVFLLFHSIDLLDILPVLFALISY